MKRILTPYKKILRFVLAGGLIFYAISGVNSLLNYALYPVLSRLMPIEQFGEAQFLLSAFNQLSVGFIVLNILAVIIAARIQNRATQNRHIASLNIVAGAIAGVIACAGVILLSTFSTSLNITSFTAVAFLGLSLLLNVPFTILVGQLQGNGKFTASAVVSFVATISKFGFSVIFALLGLGIGGVIAGVACGMFVAIMLSLFYTRSADRNLFKKSLSSHIKTLSIIKAQAVIGLCSIGIITILSTVDSLLSRALLDNYQAGLYSTVATLSKIILAATAPLLWLALPQAVNKNYTAAWRYVGLTAIIGIATTTIFSIHPAFIIETALSVNAGDYANLLVPASISMTIYAVALVLTAILLCKERPVALLYVYGGLLVSGTMLVFIATFIPQITMREIVFGQIFLGLVITVPCLILLLRRSRSTRH